MACAPASPIWLHSSCKLVSLFSKPKNISDKAFAPLSPILVYKTEIEWDRAQRADRGGEEGRGVR